MRGVRSDGSEAAVTGRGRAAGSTLALAVLFAASLFGAYGSLAWPMAWNPFFSKAVRIQRERGHHVVDRGPYAFVRHPGYAGPMLAHLALPLALGSLLGLVSALLGCGCLALRALHEERRLARELAGYAEYAARVRFRSLPRVW